MPSPISSDLKELRKIAEKMKAASDSSDEVLEETLKRSSLRTAITANLGLSDKAIALLVGAIDGVEPSGTDSYMRNAFEFCGLDPNVPKHWAILLRSFAFLHFETKKAGAHKRWDDAGLFDLAIDIRELQSTAPDLNHNLGIAQALIKHKKYKAKYGDEGVENLRKIVAKARQPAIFDFAGRPIEDISLSLFKRDFEASGKIWTVQHERMFGFLISSAWEKLKKHPILFE
jgi:hypothetical protein